MVKHPKKGLESDDISQKLWQTQTTQMILYFSKIHIINKYLTDSTKILFA